MPATTRIRRWIAAIPALCLPACVSLPTESGGFPQNPQAQTAQQPQPPASASAMASTRTVYAPPGFGSPYGGRSVVVVNNERMVPTPAPKNATVQADVAPIEKTAHTAEPPLAPPAPIPPATQLAAQPIPTTSKPPVPAGSQVLVFDTPPAPASAPAPQVLTFNPDQAQPLPPQIEIKSTPPIMIQTGSPQPHKIEITSGPIEELKPVPPAKPVRKSANGESPVLTAVVLYQNQTPAEAAQKLSAFDTTTQDLLKCLLPLAVRLGDGALAKSDPNEVAAIIDQLQSLSRGLKAKAALRIDQACFCRASARPARYGDYQPLPQDHPFKPGETAELYLELKNVSCEGSARDFKSHVISSIDIRTSSGDVLQRFDFERDQPDVGHAPREDHFHLCRFSVPNLPMGTYTAAITVTDVPTGRKAIRTLDFRVVRK